jgi:biopolymer transport protein ExbD
MMRGRSYFEVDKPRIEVIPMIDIMMFLLVFFIIITLRMIAGTGIQLDLPTSQTTQELKPTQITIGVKKDGGMYVDGTQFSAADLSAKLDAAKKENKVDVVIAGDKEVSLQTLLDVMDIVRGVGISSVGIAATNEPTRIPQAKPAQ